MYSMSNVEISDVLNAVDGMTHTISEMIQSQQMAIVAHGFMTPAAKVETILQLQAMMLRIQRGNYQQANGLAKMLDPGT